MPPESQEPFYGQEQAFYTQIESANRVIARQRKIDPMGMMGKIFAIVGAILIVIGVLIAFLLARSNPGRFMGNRPDIPAAGANSASVFSQRQLCQRRR